MARKDLEYVTQQQWAEEVANGQRDPGLSPGGAADELGIPRNAVMQAVRRGQIPMTVIVDEKGRETAYYIESQHIERYRQKHLGRKGFQNMAIDR